VIALAVAAVALTTAHPVAVQTMRIPATQIRHWERIAEHNDSLDPRPVREQAVSMLIEDRWLRGEARLRGVTVTPEEVRERFETHRAEAYGGEDDFQAYLRSSGQTEAVVRFRLRMELYREKLPIHDGLGIVSGVVFLATLLVGGFYAIGFVAFAYLLVWLSVRTPKPLHWIGRKNDYSYGVYIYGFVFQQVFASLGWTRWGYLPYVAISIAATFVAAYLSWHLVEKHALSLKGWTPRRWRRGELTPPVPAPGIAGEPAPTATPGSPTDAAAQPADPAGPVRTGPQH